MIFNAVKLLSVLSLVPLVSCTTFTHPQERPVIEEGLRTQFWDPASLVVLSLTPERRVVLHRTDLKTFCAEQPTEVGVQLSSAAKVLASANLSAERRVEIAAAIARESATSTLNARSQSLQFYLAASYTYCQMAMNGELKPEDHIRLHTELLSKVMESLKIELPHMYAAAASAAATAASAAATAASAAATAASSPRAHHTPEERVNIDVPDRQSTPAPASPAAASAAGRGK